MSTTTSNIVGGSNKILIYNQFKKVHSQRCHTIASLSWLYNIIDALFPVNSSWLQYEKHKLQKWAYKWSASIILRTKRNITIKIKDTKDKWQFCAKTSSVSENVVLSILLAFCVNVQ